MSVTCVGALVTDFIAQPIDKLDYSQDMNLLDYTAIKGGGDALNTSIVLGKLGVETRLLGKVGVDIFGDFLLEYIGRNGVDVSGVVRDQEGATSSVIVAMNSQNEHTFFYHGGTNDTFVYADIDEGYLDRSDIVHMGGTFALERFDGEGTTQLLKTAKQKNKTTTMDVSWDARGGWLDTIGPCLPYLDYFLPSIGEARELTGEDTAEKMATFLQKKGVKNVVIKLGDKGSYTKTKTGEEFYCPAFRVEVMDTTGAGDSFVGGFLTALHENKPMVECVKFATAVAAVCVQKVGATAGIINREQIDRFINKNI